MTARSALVLALCTLLLGSAAPQSSQAIPPVCGEKMPLPSDFPYDKSAYELKFGRFLQGKCYQALGWPHDKELRITGPTVASLGTATTDPHLAAWTTTTWGMHNTVLIYYSPDVYRWMCETDAAGKRHFLNQCRANCPACDLDTKHDIRPIADGSMILKEMYGNTTDAILLDRDPSKATMLSLATMVKDSRASKDGWFWGSWVPPSVLPEEAQLDWPPPVNFPYPWMGFGYYCVNCHTSANNTEFTFSELNNIHGETNSFATFYYQDQPPILEPTKTRLAKLQAISAHEEKVETYPRDKVNRVSQPRNSYLPEFLATFNGDKIVKPTWDQAGRTLAMPPEPYDHAEASPAGPALFLTSDQCVGCHASGATGAHFDMTLQKAHAPAYQQLINLAPYGEWRGSPMGLAGRDPIFLAQLETEQTTHDGLGDVIPDLCLHCHGVMGQRSFCLSQFPDPKRGNEVCNNTGLLGLDENSRPIVKRELFTREMMKAIPFTKDPAEQRASHYGGLGRDGISCTVCHHIEVEEKTPIGNTFTGDFRVNEAEKIHGPFTKPQIVPMEHSLGATPSEYAGIRNSKLCGSCHGVVLPVFDGNTPYHEPGEKKPDVGIEQATFPEWVFSDFRDGGPTPKSCQDCHMQTTYPGLPGKLSFKIAQIQEASNMPQVENRRPMSEIDLTPRDDFARHTLVGLNVFFNKFAQQFPDILGIRIQDPMLVGRGIPPLQTTFDSMIQQADEASATVAVNSASIRDGHLVADVKVENLAGHKFPSGVGFRRLFIEFTVTDANDKVIWASGRTSPTGVIIDEHGKPIRGEFFWKDNCVPMTVAEQRDHFQPHYRTITRQDQTQIYQELVRDPDDKFTTSFLALAHEVKDNRLLPKGWLPSVALAERTGLGSPKLSAKKLVEQITPKLPGIDGKPVNDPYYVPQSEGGLGGGGDALTYSIPIADLGGAQPAHVQATLYYQAIPPFYLQDRFCTTPTLSDTSRLYFLAGHTDLSKTRAEGWKLQVVSTGEVRVQ